jgi:type IV secretory pathway VirB10-like protein
MADEELFEEAEEQNEYEPEPLGGGRFNRLLGLLFVGLAMAGGVTLALALQSSGTSQNSSVQKPMDDPGSEARNRGEVEDLAAHGAEHHETPTPIPAGPIMPMAQPAGQPPPPKAPSRYAQWAAEKYLKALEAPQMVGAFHGGGTLELSQASTRAADAATYGLESQPNVSIHPAAPYTVMAGSVIPAVLISGIDSDLPGPIIAQVSQNVLDSATGSYVLIPQGSRLIGSYQNASTYGQERVSIAWQRLIFPNTTSVDLPQMPGTDQSGYPGFSDQVNHHYLATFGTAAVMSLISAGQMVGQMAAFGGGGSYGAYGYYQPNQWAMAGQMAGSAASGQLGGAGQQMVSNGLNRPPTISIRPGYEFEVMVTQDLVFGGPYGK